MPLEEPSGSSIPSAPEDEEETVASKQTHILEQVKKEWAGTSPAVQWLKDSVLPLQGARVRSLVGEQRSRRRKRVGSP